MTDDKTQHMVENYGLVQTQKTGKNNFDLDKQSVKKLILQKISIGQVFYPSDIADQHNLDLETVMDVMHELKKSKQIIEYLK